MPFRWSHRVHTGGPSTRTPDDFRVPALLHDIRVLDFGRYIKKFGCVNFARLVDGR